MVHMQEGIPFAAQSLARQRPSRQASTILRWLWRNGLGVLGIGALGFVVIAALAGPFFYSVDPIQTNVLQRLQPPAFAGGNPSNPLGTDQLGRDLLSRLIYGARISLLVGLLSTLLSLVLGVLLGLITGYYRGKLDDIFMRIGDAQLSIPFLVLAISVVAVLGPGLVNLVLTLGVTGWIQFARIVRAEALSLKQREFVEAARVIGVSDGRILLRHILPNVTSSIIVMATFQFAQMIIAEASLSFLGLGVPPPTPSWGSMINDGRIYIQVAWWLTTVPGLAIVLVVLGANTAGDWLRDKLDPHLHGMN